MSKDPQLQIYKESLKIFTAQHLQPTGRVRGATERRMLAAHRRALAAMIRSEPFAWNVLIEDQYR